MARNIIEIKNTDIYQGKSLVLSDVSLTLRQGEFIYLVGKTGSGKSSLLKTLYADLKLQNGSVRVVGNELKNIKDREIPYLRRKIGIIFQDFQLLTDRNVNENLIFVLKATGWSGKASMQSRIDRVLTKVGMKSKGFKMPFQLSGGEQQRIAIARALLNDPELIIADEPTGNLDPKTAEEIIELLIEISKNGRAVLMATHDYALILKYPSVMYRCDSGQVFEVENNDL